MEDFNSEIILKAYSAGFFPMADEENQKIHWFNPDPRAIINLDDFHVSKSLQRIIRQLKYEITFDNNFLAVMKSCANREKTWISNDFLKAYLDLHERGFCHSVEVWADSKLVGGVYGLALGGMFCAESMFHTVDNASKIALFYLIERLKKNGFVLLECQFLTSHLKSLGASEISRDKYLQILEDAIKSDVDF